MQMHRHSLCARCVQCSVFANLSLSRVLMILLPAICRFRLISDPLNRFVRCSLPLRRVKLVYTTVCQSDAPDSVSTHHISRYSVVVSLKEGRRRGRLRFSGKIVGSIFLPPNGHIICLPVGCLSQFDCLDGTLSRVCDVHFASVSVFFFLCQFFWDAHVSLLFVLLARDGAIENAAVCA